MRLTIPFPIELLLLASCAFGQGRFYSTSGTTIRGTGQPQTPVQMTCAADGVVVDTATGAPVVRAHVNAIGPGAGSSVSTDAQGRWSMAGLPCGFVQFQAQKTGYIPSNLGQGRPGAAFRSTQLQDGSPAHDLKIALTPQAVVTGKVVDENGDPVQNVQIQMIVSAIQEGQRVWQPRAGAQTNDLGEYRAHGLNAGKYIVCARPNNMPMGFNGPNSRRTFYGEMCFPGPPEGTSVSTLDVQPGREAKVDFTLQPSQGAAIRGMIVGGQQIGVGLQLRKRQGAMLGTQPTNVHFLGEGKFEISGVAPGSYYLTANVWQREARESAEVPVDVGTSDVEGVSLQLAPGFSITGTVKIETTGNGSARPGVAAGIVPAGIVSAGIVQMPGAVQMSRMNAGDAVPLNLMLRPVEGPMGGARGQLKWSDDKKSFTMSDVMAGRYRFDVNPMGAYYVKSVTLQGRDVLNEEINLQQATGPFEIVLSDDSGSVEGTLTGPDGQPATGQIMMLPDNGGRPRIAFAGPDGKVNARNIPPGGYKLYAWSDMQQAEYANPEWMRQFGGNGVAVTVAAGQTAKADLRQTVLQ